MDTNVNNLAEQFVKESAFSLFKNVVNEAYKKGFEDGVKSVLSKREDLFAGGNVKIEDGWYHDLLLPSKTCWKLKVAEKKKYKYKYESPFLSVGYLKAKEMNIPTKDQVVELLNNCRIKGKKYRCNNKESIELSLCSLNSLAIELPPSLPVVLWVRSEIINNEAEVLIIRGENDYCFRKDFIGNSHHCLLVNDIPSVYLDNQLIRTI